MLTSLSSLPLKDIIDAACEVLAASSIPQLFWKTVRVLATSLTYLAYNKNLIKDSFLGKEQTDHI